MLTENLKKGERVGNQTDKWLRPILAYVLPDYLKKYLRLSDYNLQVLGYFRGDVLYTDATLDENKSLIFVVFDVNGRFIDKTNAYKNKSQGNLDFYEFLDALRKSKFAYCDYPSRFDNRKIHICVFNLQGWDLAFESFDKGKYSHMFSDSELIKLKFDNPKEIKWIITKSEEARKLFQEKLYSKFGTTQMPDTDAEYEISPIKKEEWLNQEKERELNLLML